MKLAWQPARGNVLQYRIVYKPAEGGDRNEITVKGNTTQALLRNLQPATEYELFVSARYTSGVGDPLIGTGTTLEGKGDVKPLMYGKWKCFYCSPSAWTQQEDLAELTSLFLSLP